MKVFLSIVVVLATGAAASAQVRPVTPIPSVEATRVAGDNFLSRVSEDAYRSSAAGEPAVEKQCLAERKTGRVVCRTRAEWERIASRLSAGKSWK